VPNIFAEVSEIFIGMPLRKFSIEDFFDVRFVILPKRKIPVGIKGGGVFFSFLN
jgi:hypothetical protein